MPHIPDFNYAQHRMEGISADAQIPVLLVPSDPSDMPASEKDRVKTLSKVFFKGMKIGKISPPVVSYSSGFKDSQDIILGISGLGRSAGGWHPELKNSPVYLLTGTTSFFNCFWGIEGVYANKDRFKTAWVSDDYRELFYSGLTIGKNLALAFNGLFDLVQRSVRLGELIEDKITKPAEQLTELASKSSTRLDLLGYGMSGIFYSILTALKIANVVRDAHFFAAFNDAGSLERLSSGNTSINEKVDEARRFYTFYEKTLETGEHVSRLSARTVDAAMKELEDEWFKSIGPMLPAKERHANFQNWAADKLLQEALKEGIKGIKRVCSELGLPYPTNAQAKKIIQQLFSQEQLIKKGHSLCLRKIALKKEKTLSRIVEAGMLTKIKQLIKPAVGSKPFLERVSSWDLIEKKGAIDEIHRIVENTRAAAVEKLTIETIILACSIAGLIAAFVFPFVGVPVIASSMVFFTISMLFLAIDAYKMHFHLKEQRFEQYDRSLILMSTIICLITIAVSLILTIVFAFSPWSLLYLPLGIIWLGMNGFTWHKLSLNEYKYRKEHPNLHSLLRATPAQISAVYAKLPMEEQYQIARKVARKHGHYGLEITGYFQRLLASDPSHPDIKAAVLKRIEKLKMILKQQIVHEQNELEAYRQFLNALLISQDK